MLICPSYPCKESRPWETTSLRPIAVETLNSYYIGTVSEVGDSLDRDTRDIGHIC